KGKRKKQPTNSLSSPPSISRLQHEPIPNPHHGPQPRPASRALHHVGLLSLRARHLVLPQLRHLHWSLPNLLLDAYHPRDRAVRSLPSPDRGTTAGSEPRELPPRADAAPGARD